MEGEILRPRQVRYQAALRPDINKPLDSTAFSNGILIALVRFSGELLQNLNTPRVPLPKELRHPFVGDASCTGTSRGRRIQIEMRK